MSQIQMSLKAARITAGLKNEEASLKIGVSHGTLSKWEKNSGLVNPIFQNKIAQAYCIPVDAIFFGDELALKARNSRAGVG